MSEVLVSLTIREEIKVKKVGNQCILLLFRISYRETEVQKQQHPLAPQGKLNFKGENVCLPEQMF